MNTTDNEYGEAPTMKKLEVTKDDARAMTDAYVKGTTIDTLADEYGYTPQEVAAAVVQDEQPEPLPVTQADEDAKAVRKGK